MIRRWHVERLKANYSLSEVYAPSLKSRRTPSIGAAAVLLIAVSAGIMLSSNGNATDAPRPRNTDRRGRWSLRQTPSGPRSEPTGPPHHPTTTGRECSAATTDGALGDVLALSSLRNLCFRTQNVTT